jgi:hypothetical protein
LKTGEGREDGFRLGHDIFGPILVAFARLVLAQAEADGVDRLAFVARDGHLLLDVTRILIADIPPDERPELSYVHLSRRALQPRAEGGSDGEGSDALILQYLRQSGLLAAGVALVDVGWRGSIRKSIARVLAGTGQSPPPGYFLGLFDEDARLDADSGSAGFLCDQRRGRGPLEGAAWHAAFLLEAICRAPHGTVMGYGRTSDGAVAPRHAQFGRAHQAEASTAANAEPVKEGVLAYARWWASIGGGWIPPRTLAVRRAAQWRLFRLAFFPTRAERRLASQLVHTETDGDDRFLNLVLETDRTWRGWIAGLRSPWKGAYFMGRGGMALAALYCVAMVSIDACPPGVKAGLRKAFTAFEPRTF